MKWLIRHFLARTFDSEMFSARGQWSTIAISLCALFIPAGMILVGPSDDPAVTHAALLCLRVDAILGMLSLFAWSSLLPSRRDYLALAGLPVTSRQIFLARFAATSLLGVAASLILTIPLSAGSPAMFAQMFGGCAFVFFGIVSLQALLLNVVPPSLFARVSGTVQAVLLAVLLAMLLTSWGRPWHVPVLALSRRAPLVMMAAVALCALAHARYRRLLLEVPDVPSRPSTWRLLNLLAFDPRRRAALHFLAAVITRSATHRMVLVGYAAAAIAVMSTSLLIRFSSHTGLFESVAVYWPIGLAFPALFGMRHAFLMPAGLPANWQFQLTETQGRREWMSAVERFLLACTIAPIHIAILPFSLAAFGPVFALRLTALQLVITLTVFELVFQSWQQFPFICSYVPGRHTLMQLLAAWLLILCLIAPSLSWLAATAAGSLLWSVAAFGFLAILWQWARRQRREGWGESPLIYEDSLDMTSLGATENAPVPQWTRQPVTPENISLRLYRRMASAFPEPFRNSDFVHLTEDALPRDRHPSLRLMGDLAVRLPIEHASDLGKDIRYAFRTLTGSPGFTVAALTSLTLGICIATCAISEMNGIALREIPGVTRPGELIATQLPASYGAYQRFRAQSRLFTQSAGWVAPVPFDVRLNNGTQRVWGHLVTPSYFTTFGVRPLLGSLFDASWDTPGRPPAAVLSHRFWREHLGSDPAIVGRSLRMNGRPVTVVGVAGPEFLGASPIFFTADFFIPVTTDSSFAPELRGLLDDPGPANLRFTARLRPGVSLEQAEAALDAVDRQYARDQGASMESLRARRFALVAGGRIIPMRTQDLPYFGGVLIVLAGLIMLIACASVANMKLARAAARRREIAVRLALGASRFRLVRQLLVESLLLTATAGTIGFLGSVWLMRALTHQRMPFPMPVAYDFTPDWRVLTITLVLTFGTGLVFGLAPALQAARADLAPALKEGGEVRITAHRRINLRNVLIVSQVAGSLTLLVVLGLFSAGLQTTLGVQQGFQPANLFLLSLDPVRDGYSPAQTTALLQRLLDRVQGMPSVAAATLTESVPVSMPMGGVPVSRPGLNRQADRALRHVTGKDYFATVGIPVLAGRSFRREDEASQTNTVVVSAALASRYFPGEDPIGRPIDIGAPDVYPTRTLPGTFDYRVHAASQTATIIGVAGDVAEGLVVQKPRPTVYFPLRQEDYAHPSATGVTLIVRAVPGADVLTLVRREIATMDANITVFNAMSMRDHVEEFMGMLRSASWTYACVGIFGYVLAGVGLAGVTAYAVQQRRRELGIRMALGATSARVLTVVMKEGAVLVAIGTAIGLAGSWACSRALASVNGSVGAVTSVRADDPMVVAGATVLLATMALLACYVPARKSTRIDPAIALRHE